MKIIFRKITIENFKGVTDERNFVMRVREATGKRAYVAKAGLSVNMDLKIVYKDVFKRRVIINKNITIIGVMALPICEKRKTM